jgi:hypothetical protein
VSAATPVFARRRRLCHRCRLEEPVDEAGEAEALRRTVVALLVAFAPRLLALRRPARPKCWAWDAIAACLLDGPATRNQIAEAVYGRHPDPAQHARDRQATYQMLLRLCRGGHVERVDHGWYALPGYAGALDGPDLAALRAHLTAASRERPLTPADAAAALGLPAHRVRALLARLGDSLDARVLPARGSPRGYWLRAQGGPS